nr:hypothetical protein [Bacteroidota bacterium]
MKNNFKIYIFFLTMFAMLINSDCKGQYIQSLNVWPTNPTTNDSITINAMCQFPFGGCDIKYQQQFVNGNNLYGQAMHCLGMLTVICDETDVFKFAPLPAGTYTFNFQLDATQAMPPCTPGIVPGPTDTISFVVINANSLPENSNLAINIFYTDNQLHLFSNTNEYNNQLLKIEVLDITGKILYDENLMLNNNAANIRTNIHNQLVIVKVSDSKGNYFAKKILMN